MLKTIKFYGQLGKQFGKIHRLDVSSTLDAVQAFCAMMPGFQQAFAQGRYRVILDGTQASSKDELQLPAREIKFIPVVAGASHGIGEIFVGAAIIVASFYAPELVAAMGGSAATGTAVGTMAMSFGASLVLGGLATALSKTPQTQNSNSYLFNGAVNTTTQGNPVPILYGRLMIGSQVASASLMAYDIAIGSPTTNTGTTSTVLPNGTIAVTNQSAYKGVF